MSDTLLSPQATLGLPESATAAEAGCVFLRLLERADFVPSSLQVQALNALCRISVPVDESAEVRKREAAEVSAFAKEYWSLPPGVRRARWESLCTWCMSQSRLRELETGLDVEVTQLENADANELACLFRELFVLPRRERAIRRVKWLAEQAKSHSRWSQARNLLRREEPRLFALDKRFGEALAEECDLTVLLSIHVSQTVQFSVEQHDVTPDIAEYQQRARQYAAKTASGAWHSRFSGVWIIIGMVIFTFLFAVASERDAERRRNKELNRGIQYPNEYQPPVAGSPPVNKEKLPVPTRTFTDKEWMLFYNYKIDKRYDPKKRPPVGYFDWVISGKPQPTPEAKRP